MPITPEQPTKYTCDICGATTGLEGNFDYTQTPEGAIIICPPCQIRGNLWSCRKALLEVQESH